jgi:hypothetical protein
MRARLTIATAGAVAAAFAAPASASTIVGETPAPGDVTYECNPLEGVEDASGTGAPSYTVPAAGVITSFRHYAADAVDGQRIRLKTWRPGASDIQFEVAGASDAESLTPGTLNEFGARVPVAAGDMLGLATLTAGMECVFAGVPGDHHYYDGPGQDTPLGSSAYLTVPMSGFRWNIEATVEPDADGDGFGDETQDGCPEQGAFHGPCPPETTILSGPDFLRGPQARFRFRSSLPRSRFTCRMDKRRPRPCASPVVFRDLKARKHTFRVYATIQDKVSDPTPAKARVRPPR